MYKNLKKVISTVAALAMASSSVAALAATSFPDVADTADYATAVNELTALGIVNGYEDGTFGPDKLVTRAEITKMIVLALGSASSAESSANQNTAFTDVTANHWAAGYVTVGTSGDPAFIQGMGDGTFAPESNVTYAQAVTMLVRATGYETWAKVAGYPTGYLSYASQLGILDGVKNVGNNTELNRGQVAILIDNALEAPLLVRDGYTTDAWGNQTENLVQKDGTGSKDYASLLSNNLDAYKVSGMVVDTQKTGSGLKSDEVNFDVMKADVFTDYNQGISLSDDSIQIKANVGKTDIADYLYKYVNAIVAYDDDDDYTVLSVNLAGKNDEVTVDADLVYDKTSDSQMKFYKDSDKDDTKTSTYKLSDDVEYVLNGVKASTEDEVKTVKEYISEDNFAGTVTFVDVPVTSGSLDGKYDYVIVTAYGDAIVDSITNASDGTTKIYFENQDKGVASNLTVDPEDDDKTYTFTKDGETKAVADVKEGDVLSISYNMFGSFANSDYYGIKISDATVAGKVITYSTNDGYKIGDTYYETNDNLVSSNEISVSNEYTLYLDAFGKIVKVDTIQGAQNLCVLDAITTSGETVYASFIDQTGTKRTLALQDQSNESEYKKLVYNNGTGGSSTNAKKPVQNRVFQYSVNSSNEFKLKSTNPETAVAASTSADAKGSYTLRTNRIGSLKLSATGTVVLDFSDYVQDGDTNGYAVFPQSNLVDDEEYTAYGFSKVSSDSTYSLVIITDGIGGISVDSPLAVVSEVQTTVTDDSDDATQLKVYEGTDSKYIIVDDDVTVEDTDFNEGTPFLYTTNASGYISHFEVLVSDTVNKALADKSESALVTAALTTTPDTTGLSDNAQKGYTNSNTDVTFHFGAVSDKDSSSITLAKPYVEGTKTLSSITADNNYGYDNSVNVYVYNFSKSTGKRVSAESKGAVLSSVTNGHFADSDKDIVDWTAVQEAGDAVNVALVKLSDNDVTDVVEFQSANN